MPRSIFERRVDGSGYEQSGDHRGRTSARCSKCRHGRRAFPLGHSGELSVDPGLASYEWRTADGIAVTVLGRSVEVDWPSATGDRDDAYARMRDEVGDRLLVESLEAFAPLDVEWQEQSEVGAMTITGYGPTVTVSLNPRRPWQGLEKHQRL